MDTDMAKSMQKILTKQGIKFMLNTKVTGGGLEGETVKLGVESVKTEKKDSVDSGILPL